MLDPILALLSCRLVVKLSIKEGVGQISFEIVEGHSDILLAGMIFRAAQGADEMGREGVGWWGKTSKNPTGI